MDSDFFLRYLDAWNRHAIDEVLGFLTDDCTYGDVALNEFHTGKQAIRDFFTHMGEQFSSDYRFEPGFTVVTEHGYALEWAMQGTHDRSSPQLAATRKPYAIRGASVGELRDGKIARNTDYWSLGELLVQVGLMPEPGPARPE